MGNGAITKWKSHGHVYYYYTRSYRVKVNPGDKGRVRGTGKSRVLTEKIYLGKAEDVLKRLKEGPMEVSTEEFGLPLALWNMAKEINLIGIIDKHIPKRKQGLSIGEYIVLSAISRVSPTPPSKKKMGKWIKKTSLSRIVGDDFLSSQSFWNNFEKVVSEKEIKEKKASTKGEEFRIEEVINDDAIEKIEGDIWKELLIKYKFLLDVVLYDTTNFFTHIDKFTRCLLPQNGKSKHGMNNKRQVGLSLAVIKDFQIPLFHEVYSGNINDVTLFPTAIRKLTERLSKLRKEVKDIVVVFDKGNNSNKNIEGLGNEIKFVGGLVPSYHKDLIKIPLSKYPERYRNLSVYRGIKKVYGKDRVVIITYNEGARKRQLKTFTEKINKAKKEIEGIYEKHKDKKDIKERIIKKLKEIKIDTAKAFYYLRPEIVGGKLKLKYTTNVRWKKLTFGKSIYFSSLLGESTEKIITYYRDRNKIEDIFKILNNGVRFQPVRSWTDSKIRVHAFVCVLAVLLIKLLEYLARKNGLYMSTDILISELRDIEEAILIYRANKAERKICKMTGVQKRLFELYKLSKFT